MGEYWPLLIPVAIVLAWAHGALTGVRARDLWAEWRRRRPR